MKRPDRKDTPASALTPTPLSGLAPATSRSARVRDDDAGPGPRRVKTPAPGPHHGPNHVPDQGSHQAPPRDGSGYAPKRAGSKSLTEARVHNIAGHYVASRECSAAMLRAVLERRLARRTRDMPREDALREEQAARLLFEAEISRLIAAGLIDDARFAQMVARSGYETGLGSRRIAMKLHTRGVCAQVAEEAMALARREVTGIFDEAVDDQQVARGAEWESADLFARKRRLGPYRESAAPDDRAARRRLWAREAGKMARAGFDPDLIFQILDRDPGPEET